MLEELNQQMGELKEKIRIKNKLQNSIEQA